MMKILRRSCKHVSFALIVTGTVAWVTTAQADTGAKESLPFYIGVGAGAVFRPSAEDIAGKTTFDPGFAVNLAAGARLPYSFRLEAEASLQDVDADELDAFALGLGPERAFGHTQFTSFMANLYYDVRTPYRWLGTPYVGIGIGGYEDDIENLSNTSLRSFGIDIDSSSGYQFAFQFRVGTTYALTDRLDLSVGYRLFRGEGFDFQVPAAVGAPNNTLESDAIYLHSAEVGLKFNF